MAKAKKKKSGGQADGTRRSYFMFDPAELVIVGLDTDDGPEHPHYDERVKLPVSEALVKNIQAYGVLKPVIFERDGKRAIVVDGRQRTRGARIAAERQRAAGELEVKVPGIPRSGDATLLFGIARSANAYHQTDGPLTNARNAQRMLDMGATEDVIAMSFGVTPPTLRAWLKLLGLSPAVRKAVERGELSPTAAVPLGLLSKADQDATLSKLSLGGAKPTAAKIANAARVKDGKAPIDTPAAKLKRIVAIIEDVMGPIHGDCQPYGDLDAAEAASKIRDLLRGVT